LSAALGIITLQKMSAGKFTTQAAVLWKAIPLEVQQRVLKNAFCLKCRTVVQIVNFTGLIDMDDLILTGSCAVCGDQVVRSLETSEFRKENN
jgi:hypothetical protein